MHKHWCEHSVLNQEKIPSFSADYSIYFMHLLQFFGIDSCGNSSLGVFSFI